MSRAEGPADHGGSRPSKTNRAGPGEGSGRPNLDHERFDRPLTERNGVALRQEVVTVGDEGGFNAVDWGQAIDSWRDYILQKRDTAAILEGPGGRVETSDPHRFHPDYSDKQYAKLKDLERGLRDAYGRRLHTAMLTLTASSTGTDGRPRPPVDHLHDLDASWSAVRRELARQLRGRRWEYLAILEPHESGYLHIHVAVFVDGRVTADWFRPVVEAHVRNCPAAEWDAHDPTDEGVISVNHVGESRGAEHIGNLGTYLAEYVGAYGDNPLEAPAAQQAANAILWATGKQRWRPSQGAQAHMSAEQSEPEPGWELVAVRGADGEVHEVDGSPPGGVRREKTRPPPGLDEPPPPRREWWERDPGGGRRPL